MATPTKRRNFTFSLKVQETKNIDAIIATVSKFPKYAYIIHDKDVHTETGELKDDHYHFYVEFPNPRSFSSLANDLNISTNYIEKVYDKTAILEYLTHENQPDKHHYDRSEIITNMDFDNEIIKRIDVTTEYKDWLSLMTGKLSAEDWFKKYASDLAKISVYNRLKIYSDMFKARKGLSTCRVPCSICNFYPCKHLPTGTASAVTNTTKGARK